MRIKSLEKEKFPSLNCTWLIYPSFRHKSQNLFHLPQPGNNKFILTQTIRRKKERCTVWANEHKSPPGSVSWASLGSANKMPAVEPWETQQRKTLEFLFTLHSKLIEMQRKWSTRLPVPPCSSCPPESRQPLQQGLQSSWSRCWATGVILWQWHYKEHKK